MHAISLVTLITDFGIQDPYVGQMKGAILSRNPEVQIIDICHHIPPHDTLAAALVLESSYGYFPAGTVHLTVVDPGVGGQRHILAAAGGGHLFIAPDNGVLSLLLQKGTITEVRLVENRALYPTDVSATFHGRDIMAPVAAALAGNLALAETGPPVPPERCTQIQIPQPIISDRTILGEVIHIDHFGNIKTNITTASLSRFPPERFRSIEIQGQRIDKIVTTYSDQPRDRLIALIDSGGYLEIALNRGSAARLTGCRLHEPVKVLWR